MGESTELKESLPPRTDYGSVRRANTFPGYHLRTAIDTDLRC